LKTGFQEGWKDVFEDRISGRLERRVCRQDFREARKTCLKTGFQAGSKDVFEDRISGRFEGHV
jgi:hypothetical protein